MKKIIHILLTVIAITAMVSSCASSSRGSSGGEVTGIGATSWAEPTPYGMVLVSRGSVKMGPAKADSAWNLRIRFDYGDIAVELEYNRLEGGNVIAVGRRD